MNQFRCRHLASQRHRGKKSLSLAPKFMSTNARSKLWLRISERVLTKWRNPEETEEDVMASGSSREVSNSGVSSESVGMESKPCSKPVCPTKCLGNS